MNKFLLLFTLFSFSCVHSQIAFEKGNIVTVQNQNIECLIKNQDWLYAPKQIEYKLTETGAVETMDFDQIQSFQVYNSSQYYQKHTVQIDRKKDHGNFTPVQETIVLKVLLEGSATLFSEGSDLFFYRKEGGDIKQLVYKKYQDGQFIKENHLFRNELYENLKCGENTAQVRKLKYNKRDLTEFFKDYNSCLKSDFKTFTDQNTKLGFNFNVLAGINFNGNDYPVTAKIPNPPSGGQTTFFTKDISLKSNNTSVALGIEGELLLPFNKHKWSVFAAPNYQQQKYDLSGQVTKFETVDVSVQYGILEVPLGIRHYFVLNTKNKIFLDAAYCLVFVTDAKEDKEFVSTSGAEILEGSESDFDTAARIGLGYKYHDRYSVSINYGASRKISESEIGAISVIATYKLF